MRGGAGDVRCRSRRALRVIASHSEADSNNWCDRSASARATASCLPIVTTSKWEEWRRADPVPSSAVSSGLGRRARADTDMSASSGLCSSMTMLTDHCSPFTSTPVLAGLCDLFFTRVSYVSIEPRPGVPEKGRKSSAAVTSDAHRGGRGPRVPAAGYHPPSLALSRMYCANSRTTATTGCGAEPISGR